MKHTILAAALCLGALAAPRAHAFCGFYVGKADAKLFNHASQVALVHHEDRTVITMSNDFEGNLKEFAMVIPVPTVLEREQIHVGDRALIDHLDAFSAPRLVEYWDEDPCARREALMQKSSDAAGIASMAAPAAEASRVRIEARYTIGEYDILILSAEQSDGLQRWLAGNGYKVPAKANRVLKAYIRQGLHFFVAKVNLGEQKKLGFTYLRPLQIAYESPRFMLPIRLGMVNADGAQELFVYAITPTGRVECTNYRTVPLPTDIEVPLYVKDHFGDFYKDLFRHQVGVHDMSTVFTEYAWDMSWCDPCASEPLSQAELDGLGVFWNQPDYRPRRGGSQPGSVFLTRLHVRYDAAHFPEDLVFQETGNRQNFQARYVMRHPFQGTLSCSTPEQYRGELERRHRQQVRGLASLTNWDESSIRTAMSTGEDAYLPAVGRGPSRWWQGLWRK